MAYDVFCKHCKRRILPAPGLVDADCRKQMRSHLRKEHGLTLLGDDLETTMSHFDVQVTRNQER